jgi:hypothetical protein
MYVPFGDEWKRPVEKLPKRELVEMLAKALREKQEIQMATYRNREGSKYAIDAIGNELKIDDPLAVVGEHQFWCIVCRAVKDLSIGVVASIEIGGWACDHHTLAEIAQRPSLVVAGGLTRKDKII